MVTDFANLLHYEFVVTTTRRTRDPASLSNQLLPTEAGKKTIYVEKKGKAFLTLPSTFR